MRNDHPLTLTVEQAGQALGVGRSTAYELVRTGELESIRIRLRRRIAVPIAHLADLLGVTPADVWSVLQPDPHPRPPTPNDHRVDTREVPARAVETLSLF